MPECTHGDFCGMLVYLDIVWVKQKIKDVGQSHRMVNVSYLAMQAVQAFSHEISAPFPLFGSERVDDDNVRFL